MHAIAFSITLTPLMFGGLCRKIHEVSSSQWILALIFFLACFKRIGVVCPTFNSTVRPTLHQQSTMVKKAVPLSMKVSLATKYRPWAVLMVKWFGQRPRDLVSSLSHENMQWPNVNLAFAYLDKILFHLKSYLHRWPNLEWGPCFRLVKSFF